MKKYRRAPFCFFCFLWIAVLGSFSIFADETFFGRRIEDDWARQESHQNRTLGAPESLQNLLERAGALLTCLEENELADAEPLGRLRTKLNEVQALDLSSLSEEERAAAYRELRWTLRDTAFQNDLMKETPLVFLKGDRFGYQNIHGYLSYYPRYSNMHGGGLMILKRPGYSFETTSLTDDFPRGILRRRVFRLTRKRSIFRSPIFRLFKTPKRPGSTCWIFGISATQPNGSRNLSPIRVGKISFTK